jgi:hypothetical protein
MVGAPALSASLRGARRLVVFAALVAAPLVPAQPLEIGGICRDGEPQGAYTLHAPDGRLLVAGALAKGHRTGTFVFWSESGSRVAVIPYDDDRKSGTVAVWYAPPSPGADAPRRSEAAYVNDQLHGEKRSWYPNGKPRTRLRYVHGDLIEAQAYAPSGATLSDAEARRRAHRDAAADQAFYATLEGLVALHSPRCDGVPP